jgi:hypothetical protein
MMNQPLFSRTLPAGYAELLPVWNRLAKQMQAVYVTLGVSATICSITLATFTTELGTSWIKVVSFCLALSIALITSFDIGAKANSARGAWRLLNAACLAYANDESFTIQDLYKQYVAGEAMLGNIKFNAPTAKPLSPSNSANQT